MWFELLLNVFFAALIGGILPAVLIYLGIRRARKETARLKNPTKWDYINQAAGYWVVAGVFICRSIYMIFVLLFG